MNADEYQKLAMRTAATPDLFNNNVDGSMDDVLHALLGIGTEAGELQDMLKKHLMYGKAFDRTNLVEECGDLLWYIALALKTVNVTMSDCMERNIKKLQVRYPQKFTTENALNRNLEQEARVLASTKERVAVLRHHDGWRVYSDGSDDDPHSPCPAGCYVLGDYRSGEMVSWPGYPVWSKRPCFTALIDWPPRPADERVAEATHTPEPPPPETEVSAAVRPWFDALREVWPDMRAEFDGTYWYDVQLGSGPDVHCYVRCNGDDSFVSSLLYCSVPFTYPHYSTPAELVAALKKVLADKET